ncbi:MAG TPA: CHAD domain-containing protein [Ignavibacteria bacterium]|jgi:CHAD domain-containing protein
MAKARKIPYLNSDQPLNICLQKILRTRFNEMISYEEGTLLGDNIEYLHNMRVSSRRVQAMLKIFRGAFPPKKFMDEYKQIRLLIRSLGEVRDYDVFIKRLEEFHKESIEQDNRALDMLIIRKKVERDNKRKVLVKTINDLNRLGYKENFMRFITENL